MLECYGLLTIGLFEIEEYDVATLNGLLIAGLRGAISKDKMIE